MTPLELSDSPLALGGWARRYGPGLERLGLHTITDLLHHFPRRYIDRSAVVEVRDLRDGNEATFIGTVKKVRTQIVRRRMPIVTVTVFDGTGYVDLSWFNQRWPARAYREEQEVAVSGKVGTFRRRLQIQNPAVEVLRGGSADHVHTGRIVPVHPAAEGISTGVIRRLVYETLQRVGRIPDSLPDAIRVDQSVIGLDEALRLIHFPEDPDDEERARERLKFDELFFLELGVAFRKWRVETGVEGVAHEPASDLTERLLEALPFELTGAQRRAIEEIAKDMASPTPMNRLLQGDVGSGKTVVALAAAVGAIASGHQAAIMAPTEVLAGQHFDTITDLLAPVGGRPVSVRGAEDPTLFDESSDSRGPVVALLTASITGGKRDAILDGVASGGVDLLVGTHALVQEHVRFHDLSFAVVDEQQRFGLHQRIALKEKGSRPDVLIMTATPIPRTLALTYYGDLDVSTLDEMPAGRPSVTTRVARTPAQRDAAYELIRTEANAGRQAFVVCAAIDEQNRLEVKAAEKEARRLATEIFPELKVALLHGRLAASDKGRQMEAFRRGDADVLISTTVIEVGIDLPNATVMLVENAERFGLSQLHQLRGRIGRGAHESWCILFDESSEENEDAKARLAAMTRTRNGFELADEDLRLRGEGTLFDVQQSGMPDLRLARLSEDLDLVKRARAKAFALIEEDPGLEQHVELRHELERRFADSIDWLFHS
ncbi:MAG: ATP-dependent DNA helicase RecG [Actinomycetota bacterium]